MLRTTQIYNCAPRGHIMKSIATCNHYWVCVVTGHQLKCVLVEEPTAL